MDDDQLFHDLKTQTAQILARLSEAKRDNLDRSAAIESLASGMYDLLQARCSSINQKKLVEPLQIGNTRIVLIDDDDSNLADWRSKGLDKGIHIDYFSCEADFIEKVEEYSLDTHIFVDWYFGNSTSLSFIKKLKSCEFGFKYIHVTTHTPDLVPKMTHLFTSIIGKEPPY